MFVFGAAFLAGDGDAEVLRAAVGDGDFPQPGRLGEDAAVGAVAAQHRRQRAVAAAFFIDDAFQQQIAAQAQAGSLQRRHAQPIRHTATLHIRRAAPINPPIDQFAAEGWIAPGLGRADRHDVDVTVQLERAAAACTAPAANDIRALSVRKAGRHISGMSSQFRIIRRPIINLKAELGVARGDQLLAGALLALQRRDAHELLQQLQRVVPQFFDGLLDGGTGVFHGNHPFTAPKVSAETK